MHAAVIAINDAIDQGVPQGTMAAMQNPNAMLVNLDADTAQNYHDMLYQAKGQKVANSRKRVRQPPARSGSHPRRVFPWMLKDLTGCILPMLYLVHRRRRKNRGPVSLRSYKIPGHLSQRLGVSPGVLATTAQPGSFNLNPQSSSCIIG